MTMDATQKDTVVAECRELMTKAKYGQEKIDQFCDTVSEILQEVIDNFDEQRETKYKLKKHIDRVEFKLDISGSEIDPMTDGEGAQARRRQDAVNHVLFNPETSVSVHYTPGWNHLTVKSPSKIANS